MEELEERIILPRMVQQQVKLRNNPLAMLLPGPTLKALRMPSARGATMVTWAGGEGIRKLTTQISVITPNSTRVYDVPTYCIMRAPRRLAKPVRVVASLI